MSLRDKDGNLIPKNLLPDTFNNYFSSVASNLISSLSSPVNDFKSYLNTPCPNSIFINPSTISEVTKVISTLNNKKSPLTEIPIIIYKMFSQNLAEPISIIFNNMIETGIFPDTLKISRVTPVFKK